MRSVLVPAVRIERWLENFAGRHDGVTLGVHDGGLCGVGGDGSQFRASPPFSQKHQGPASLEAFLVAMQPPAAWGVLLVRRGGFAVASLSEERIVAHKIGQRHVQGKTKAGGQSQQRFARRRDNQARKAFEAAAEHAARILKPGPLVVGGDRAAIAEVLTDSRLGSAEVVGLWHAVPDPKRQVLDQAIRDALSASIELFDS